MIGAWDEDEVMDPEERAWLDSWDELIELHVACAEGDDADGVTP